MNENETIEITSKLEYKDFIRARRYIASQSILFKIYLFSPVIYFIFVLVNCLVTCPASRSLTCFSFVIDNLLGLSTFFMLPIIVFLLNIGLKKYFDSNKRFQQEGSLSFDLEGVKSFSDNYFNFIKWTDIYKIMESKEDLLIFISTIECHIIPKRFFKSAEDLEKVKEIIKQKVDPKKVKLLKNKKHF